MGAIIDCLHPLPAIEGLQGFRVDGDGDVVPGGWLLPHDGPATQMGFDVGVVGRHHRNDGLVQPRGGLGAEISRHAVALVRVMEAKNRRSCL